MKLCCDAVGRSNTRSAGIKPASSRTLGIPMTYAEIFCNVSEGKAGSVHEEKRSSVIFCAGV